MTALKWLYERRVTLLSFALIFCIGIATYLYLRPAQTVTYESQQQAETPQGVQEAAHNAHVPISDPQAVEAAKEIERAADRKPDKVVKTTVQEMPKVVESEQQKAGADFAIVADPRQPNKIVKPAELPKGTNITLNQYNIKAYPQHLAEVTIYSNKDFDAAYMSKVKVLGATGYVGAAVGQSDGKIKVGIRVSVPF